MTVYDPLEDRVEHLLQTYTLEEILELAGIEQSEVLYRLIADGIIELPEVEPL
jgi:hypothetical protein